MLLRCLIDHQVSQNETMHFEPGKVYRFEGPAEDLGRRLLQDFGRNSRHQARHGEVKFERVAVEGDTTQIVQDGAPVDHIVTAEEGYSGEAIEVTPQGPVAPGESGTVDHSHLSQSEPPQPPYGDKLAYDGDNAEGDHTTATEGGSGTGAPLGQVGDGQAGDTLSTDVGGKAPDTTPEYTSESNVGTGQTELAPSDD